MLRFKEYLNAISRKNVLQIYKRLSKDKGVVQSSQAVNFIQEWVSENVHKKLKSLTKLEEYVLSYIYGSGKKGAIDDELQDIAKAVPQEELSVVIEKLESYLLIYFRNNGTQSYHGIKDYVSVVFELGKSHLSDSFTDFSYTSLKPFVVPHIIYIVAHIKRKKIRITQNKELHLKDIDQILARINYSKILDTNIPQESVSFFFDFLNYKQFIKCKNEHIYISESFFEEIKNDEVLIRELYAWWYHKRLLDTPDWLEQFLTGASIWPIHVLNHFFAPYNESLSKFIKFGTLYLDYSGGLKWEQICLIVRELVFLGGINLSYTQGKFVSAQIDLKVIDCILNPHKIKKVAPKPVVCMPNFEFILEGEVDIYQRYLIELISQRANDDLINRYNISKDSIMKASNSSNVNQAEVLNLIDTMQSNEGTKKQIVAWVNNCFSTFLKEMLVLEVSDKEVYNQIQRFPFFKKNCIKKIVGFGFIFEKKYKEMINRHLDSLNIKPIQELPQIKEEDFYLHSATSIQTPSYYQHEIYFQEKEGIASVVKSNLLNKEKIISNKIPSLSEKIEVIQKALQQKKNIELSFVEVRDRFKVRPLRLMRSDYSVMISINIKTGQRYQCEVNNVTSIRIVNQHG